MNDIQKDIILRKILLMEYEIKDLRRLFEKIEATK